MSVEALPVVSRVRQGLVLWSEPSLSDSETTVPIASKDFRLSAAPDTSTGWDGGSSSARPFPAPLFEPGNEPLFPRHFIWNFSTL
jgi:hypothetical protein